MPTIAIIDDRVDQRDTLKNYLELLEEGDWNVIAENPLSQLDEYISWIKENDIAVLLLDEKLNETNGVSYNGHNLVDFLRGRIATLPIFVITSFGEDEELKQRFKDVEDIIDRNKFAAESANYYPRFFRAGQKYIESYGKELETLSKVTRKIVENNATDEEITEIEAIRTKLGIEFDVEKLSNKSQLIKGFEEELGELDKLKNEIEGYLKENDAVEKNN